MSEVFVTQSAREAVEKLEREERNAVTRFLKERLVDFAESQSPRKISGIAAPVWVARVSGGSLVIFEKDEQRDRFVALAVLEPSEAAALDVAKAPQQTYEIGQSLLMSLAQDPPQRA